MWKSMLKFEHFWKCTPEMYPSLFRFVNTSLNISDYDIDVVCWIFREVLMYSSWWTLTAMVGDFLYSVFRNSMLYLVSTVRTAFTLLTAAFPMFYPLVCIGGEKSFLPCDALRCTVFGIVILSVCLTVCPSVCHTCGLCPHGSTYDHDFFTIW